MFLIFLFVLWPSLVFGQINPFGGIDFSGSKPTKEQLDAAMESITIPEFHSKEEALKYAEDIKYVQPIYTKMKKHAKALLDKANYGWSAPTDPGIILKTGRLITQYAWCMLALEEMKKYKAAAEERAMDMVADDAMISPPHFKNRQEAIRWANQQKGNPKAIALMEQMVFAYYAVFKDDPNLKKIAEQLASTELALEIMENFQRHGDLGDDAQVAAKYGATIQVSSRPLTAQEYQEYLNSRPGFAKVPMAAHRE